MRVLITGGGGFLGATIMRRLMKSNINVRVFDTSNNRDLISRFVGEKALEIEWHVGDITDASAVLNVSRGCDAIIHLAGVMTPYCQKDPLSGAMINVIGTINVFEAAKYCGIHKVIYTSSGGVFGLEDDEVPFPMTHYGAFKLANEGSARAYWAEDRIASIGFRPFVIYGPGREVGLSAGPTLACKAAAKGEPYTIPLTGVIGLVYVEDVAAAFEMAACASIDGAHTINLSGEPISIDGIVEVIRRLVPGAQIDCKGKSLPSVSTVKDEYINALLSFPPATSLENGLRQTIEFYRESYSLANA